MADTLPTTNSYKLLGGINQKASRYEMSTAQFLDLRNVDFDVPNALQKRPGSSFAVLQANGTSGPISSIFEFIKLTGESYVIAGSDTAMFYITANAYTLLDSGWNNGQPVDMLTFANKAWMANGQHFKWWDGVTAILPAGLPDGVPFLFNDTNPYLNYNGSTIGTMGGATAAFWGPSFISRAVYMAQSYVRQDGYIGPADFLKTARNVASTGWTANGSEFFANVAGVTALIGGFTIPSGYGITAIAIWVAVDFATPNSTSETIPGVGTVQTGDLGWVTASPFWGSSQTSTSPFAGYSSGSYSGLAFLSATLKPTADLSRFWLYTLIPASALFLSSGSTALNNNYPMNGGGRTYWAANFSFGVTTSPAPNYNSYTAAAFNASAFSGMPFGWFDTYIPKYIEVNQNVGFYSGFSVAPSTVWFTSVGQMEDIQPDNNFDIRTNDGDRIYAQKAFNGQMIFCKEHSFAKLIGDNSNNFQLVDLSDDFGCLSNNTMLVKDNVMFWLDRKGILEYTGASWKIVSDAVEGIFRRMNISAAKEKAVAVHNVYRNQLWWGIPIDGSTTNNITVVFDYLIGAWTFFDGFNPASFGYVKSFNNKPGAWRGDYSGLVHFTGESFFGDSGRGITCLAFTRFENSNGENATTLWRRFFLDAAASADGTGQINGQIFANYDSSTVQSTFSIGQTIFQSRVEMGINAKSVAAQFSHSSASLPLLINGYSWAQRPLRNV